MVMNQSIDALNKFIDDFALKQPNGIVYFYANIQMVINSHLQVLSSDVHIITSDNLATIYILSKSSKSWEGPDMFTPKKDSFTYIENEYLRIESTGDYGKYIVSISPKQEEIF